MVGVLGGVLDKPGGIDVRTASFAAPGEEYGVVDLFRIEAEQRRTQTTGEEASLHVLMLNGSFAEAPGVLKAGRLG